MNVQELIDMLNTIEDKTVEVVTRGQNHAGYVVTRASSWVARDPKASHETCDCILPDSQYIHDGYYDVLVID